jgi:putative redox protein
MECKVKWIDGVSFVAETGSGHALVMDGAPEGGGRNLGPRPMEMVLLGTGGCSAYDVVVILKKSGQEISGCRVELKAERAETGSGHALVMDGAPEGGGRNLGPRPMEMVLLGTGGCSAYDVVVILKKSGQEISGCSVELKAERAETDPKIFTRIHMHFVLRGKNLKTSMVESAIKLSHQKYCSASIMLGKTAEITHDYEIVAE